MLICRYRRQGHAWGAPFDRQARIEHRTAIATLSVLRDKAQQGRIFLRSLRRPLVEVGAGVFVTVIIIQMEVQIKVMTGPESCTQPPAACIGSVGMLSRSLIMEKAILSFVVTAERKGEILCRVQVSGESRAAGAAPRGKAGTDVRAAVVQRVACVDPH